MNFDSTIFTISQNNAQISAKEVSKIAHHLKNYAGTYNFRVSLFNKNSFECLYDNQPKKRTMRGGRFFLTSFIRTIYFIFHLAASFAWSAGIKYLIPISLAITVLYVVITTYNLVIYKKNGNIIAVNFLCDNSVVKDGWLNTFYEIEINNQHQMLQIKNRAANIELYLQRFSTVKNFTLMFYQDNFYTELTGVFILAYFVCILMFTSSIVIMAV